MMAQQFAAASGVERKSLHLQAPGGGRPRLLLAEDSEPIRVVTSAMLKAMGCDVEAVVHGEHAVKSASETRFDVIVLDIEMPIMDGITAARSIRQLGGAAGTTPLMALSAFLADSVRGGSWRDTFDIALPKPANRNELHGAVKAALLCQSTGLHDLPPVIDVEAFAIIRSGITAGIWQQLRDMTCRDIEVCVNQLEHIIMGQHDMAVLIYAAKLEGLGRTFAAPRLAAVARQVQSAPSDHVRNDALKLLFAAGRATVASLRN
jgi:CheY-like chemotaxis protein